MKKLLISSIVLIGILFFTSNSFGGVIYTTSDSGIGTDDQTAAEVVFTPAGGIAAIEVQSAVEELDTEKANLTTPTFVTSTLMTNGLDVRVSSTDDGHEFSIQGYDVDNAIWRDILTFINGDTPTVTLGSNTTLSGIGVINESSIDNYQVGGVSLNDLDMNFTVPQTMIGRTQKRYYPAILNDNATPHVLTITEVSDTLITTQGWNGTDDIEFTLPDISAYDGTEGVLKVKFLDSKGNQDADTDFYINPDDNTQAVLDGVITGTDGHRIWNDNTPIYSSMVCHSEYDSTLKGYWVCDTINGTWADKGS